MQSRKYTPLIVSLLALTVCLLAISTVLLVRISSRAADVTRSRAETDFKWHLMMIAKRTDSPFWRAVYEGAREEGRALGAVVEMVGPSSDADQQTGAAWMDYAVAARVNGILSYLSDTPPTREALASAARRGIPVIALESDTVPEARQSFVGVNSFELGKLLGSLIRDAVGTTGTAMVLLDDATVRGPENIMLSAVQNSMKGYPGIRVVPFGIDSGSTAGFETAIRQRILNDRSLDTIVCLNVEDTVRVAQAVIELNQAKHISIIAFRESDEILNYVRKGIIRAVIVVDATQMGKKAVQAMIELLETKHANDYVITDMHVITRENLEESR